MWLSHVCWKCQELAIRMNMTFKMTFRCPNSEPSSLIPDFFHVPNTYLPAHQGIFVNIYLFVLANIGLSILKLIIRRAIFGWIPMANHLTSIVSIIHTLCSPLSNYTLNKCNLEPAKDCSSDN